MASNAYPSVNTPLNPITHVPLVKLEPTSKTTAKPKDKPRTWEAILEAWNKYWIYELGSCLLSLVFFMVNCCSAQEI